ncbi:barstar family protein [Catenuloplanes atrovinosus]|uniref:Barstar (barnase inhibitor) domain-containing protein n=1 Tax=Catenuloplanes atrovinosus TaxID=137266 RepID=A0AAE3YN14_9ACTN|nr:barstar family protein [Catenuloplanes atrovinosus]MDR7274806.1 hypothetical protein [Catenuloplanes atrovinosus]
MTHVRPFLEVVVLDAVAASLRARGQRVVRLDASGWTEDGDFHREIAAALDFPDHYGGTLDALTDCLNDLVRQERAKDGLAVAFVGYDGFAEARPATARAALEIIGEWCAAAARHGQHLSCLVQPPIDAPA